MQAAAVDRAVQGALAAATLLCRNLVPIYGIVVLDWSAVSVIVLYFADFLLDITACLLLLALLDPEAKEAARKIRAAGEWVKTLVGVLIAGVFLLACFAFVFGMPVFIAIGDKNPFDDPWFRNGLAVHLVLSSWNFVLAYRYLSYMIRTDPQFKVDAAVKGRFQYITGRWLAVYLTGFVGAAFPLIMVIAYCGATLYSIFHPRRIEEFLNLPREEKSAAPRLP